MQAIAKLYSEPGHSLLKRRFHFPSTQLLAHLHLNDSTDIAAKTRVSDRGDACLTLGLPNKQKRVADILVGRPVVIQYARVYVLGYTVDEIDNLCM